MKKKMKSKYWNAANVITWTSWSSVRADRLTKMGKRPMNSGIRPYAIRSLLSTWKGNTFSDFINRLELSIIILNTPNKPTMNLKYPNVSILTDSSSDEVTTASITPPALILARTGTPNPIDESCLLQNRIRSAVQIIKVQTKLAARFECIFSLITGSLEKGNITFQKSFSLNQWMHLHIWKGCL